MRKLGCQKSRQELLAWILRGERRCIQFPLSFPLCSQNGSSDWSSRLRRLRSACQHPAPAVLMPPLDLLQPSLRASRTVCYRQAMQDDIKKLKCGIKAAKGTADGMVRGLPVLGDDRLWAHLLLEAQQAGVQRTTIPGGCSTETSRDAAKWGGGRGSPQGARPQRGGLPGGSKAGETNGGDEQ